MTILIGALVFVLALWFVTLLGAAAKHDEAQRVIDGLRLLARHQAATITNQRRELARLNAADIADRQAAALAFIEAQRFDPDDHDWSQS